MSGHRWPWPYDRECTPTMRCCGDCTGEEGHICADVAASGYEQTIEYGSVLPKASGPDVFYDSLSAAASDCAFGPCRIVSRVVARTPWVDVAPGTGREVS